MLLVHTSGALRCTISKELNEDPHTVPEKLSQLKTWLAAQPHLPKFDDDARLISFLRGCKFNMEKTKLKVDMYFSMRAAAPEVFSSRDPLSAPVQRIWEETQILPLSDPTPDGSRIMWMTSPYSEIDVASPPENIKLAFMIGDMRLALEEGGCGSDVYVFDASYANMEQFAKFTPLFIRKFFVCVKAAYPVRVRQVHIINMNPVVEYVLGLVTVLIADKIKNRIFHHGKDYKKSLSKYIPQELWPEDFGGKTASTKEVRARWRKTIEENRQWFLDQDNVKTDESKRPGKPLNYEEMFGGMQQNFKKLAID